MKNTNIVYRDYFSQSLTTILYRGSLFYCTRELANTPNKRQIREQSTIDATMTESKRIKNNNVTLRHDFKFQEYL